MSYPKANPFVNIGHEGWIGVTQKRLANVVQAMRRMSVFDFQQHRFANVV
jgi:hypothetical protein